VVASTHLSWLAGRAGSCAPPQVIRAVQDSGKELLLTGLLVLFIIYAYSIVGFVYFRCDCALPNSGEAKLCATQVAVCHVHQLCGGCHGAL
jgi:hypothetical protein